RPSPIKDMIDNLQKDRALDANERTEVNQGLMRTMSSLDPKDVGESLQRVATNREKGEQDVGTWYNPKTKEIEETTRSEALQQSALTGQPSNFVKMTGPQRTAIQARQTQINDVQLNVSRFTDAVNQYATNPPSD